MLRVRLLTPALGLALLVCASPAVAATIDVTTLNDDQQPGDGLCSLRKAIEDVNAPGSTQHDCAPAAFGANTIVLGSGSYLIGFSGGLHIASTVTNLTFAGAGEGRTFIDGQLAADRVFAIASGASVLMRNLTIANGRAPAGASGEGGDGGGILNQGTLTLLDSGVSDNHAGNGADGNSGVPGSPGMPGGSGGGIYNTGRLTLDGATLSDNDAGRGGNGGAGAQGSGGAGGAGGPGGEGGGVMNAGGSLTVESSTFRSNVSGSGGGGGDGGTANVAHGGDGGPGGAGGSGGAIESDGGSLSVTNSTFASNFAGAGVAGGNGGAAPSLGGVGGAGGPGGAGAAGGAVRVVGTSAATLLQTTSAGNAASGGGAGGTGGNGATPGALGAPGPDGSGGGVTAEGTAITLQNSLLALNGGGNCGPGVIDGGHNLAFGDATCPATFTGGDPDLGPLQDNGGPAPTIGLQPGSAAIDQIPATGAGCPAADERGVARPEGSRCDVGAYEVAPPSATTLRATAVIRNAAFLNASVIPNAGAANVVFQYGRTTQYGHTSPAATPGGVTPVDVSERVSHLAPKTTYHFRVVVTTQDGKAYGLDRTFTTRVAVIKHLRVSPATLRPGRPASVTYTDSARALTRFEVWRCVEGKRKCIRYLPVRRFTHRDRAGRNRLRLRGRRLTPGRYLVSATATRQGNSGPTARAFFKVV